MSPNDLYAALLAPEPPSWLDLSGEVPPELTNFDIDLIPSELVTVTVAGWLAEGELIQWLINAPPGASRCYHSGQLAHDRASSASAGAAGELMARAALGGLVLLFQRRSAPTTRYKDGSLSSWGSFDYLAYRTAKPWQGELPPLPPPEEEQADD